MTQISVVAPGLLGPMKNVVDLESLPLLPSLERCLTRSTKTPFSSQGYEETLFQVFHVGRSATGDFPVAALNRSGDDLPPDTRYWLQISPIYLRPDQGRLLLFDSFDLDFVLSESKQLAEAFSSHFADQSWRLEVVTPHRWYLSLDVAPALQTSPPESAFGRSIDSFLPQGDDALYWHGVMNETQMLFHSLDVNQRREERGKLPINGVWISGGGVLPETVKVPFDYVLSDSALLWGLANLASVKAGCLPEDGFLPAEGDQLYVYEALHRPVLRADPFDWADGLGEFDKWLNRLVYMLVNRQIDRLCLYPCDGYRYQLTRGSLRKFWRSDRSFLEQMLA